VTKEKKKGKKVLEELRRLPSGEIESKKADIVPPKMKAEKVHVKEEKPKE